MCVSARFENSSQIHKIINGETVYLNMCSQEEGLTWIYLTGDVNNILGAHVKVAVNPSAGMN